MIHSGPYGEDNVSARVGSTEDLDQIDEDFNKSPESKATGYHGKNSELTWMQRLRMQASHDMHGDGVEALSSGVSQTRSTAATPISKVTYHCDDLGISLPEEVDLLELPPRYIADALFNDYLESVHPVFPIIGKQTFSDQYRGFFNHGREPAANWRAILNMIFAISAKHAHLIEAPWRGDERDHLVYFTRARGLGFNIDSLLVHADMQRIQITGLMAFYLLATNQVNR